MGLWADIAGIVAAPFTGGATLIPALIGAGADIAGAAVQSHQTSKASNAQQQAAQQGLTLLGQLYNQGKAGLSPYQQLGTSTLPNLYALTGQTAPNAANPQVPLGTAFHGGPGTMPSPPGARTSGPGWSPGVYNPQGGGISSTWQGPGVNPNFVPGTAGYNAQMAAQGAQVTLRAPDGSTKQVPAEQAEFYVQKGAVRV